MATRANNNNPNNRAFSGSNAGAGNLRGPPTGSRGGLGAGRAGATNKAAGFFNRASGGGFLDRNRDFSSPSDAAALSPPPNSGNASPGPEQPASPHSEPLPAFDPQSVPVPKDLIYDLNTFLKFQHMPEQSSSTPPAGMGCPPGIWKVASKLWKSMPEYMDKFQDSGNLRDRLFADDSAAATSKVLHDRKLHHEVRGILGKVTEANLETMQRSLTDLPIRQSTEEEIHEVINVFFSKSTRPEDSRYTPLYVNLVVHLIDSIGTDPAATMIRKEIITQCKDTFLSASDDSKKLEEICADLPDEEAELERMKFTGKQKANIFFLGLMFVNKLITEHIIMNVLDGLCYGRRRRNRFPADNDIINFIELLQTCGPHFSPAQNDKLEQFRTDLTALCESHTQMRIKVLLQNCLETMANNWIPLHGPKARRDHPPAGGMASSGSPNHSSVASPASPASNSMNFTRGSGGAQQGGNMPFGRGSPLAQSTGPGSPAVSRPPVREEFWKAMDEYFTSKSLEELTAMMERLPSDQVVTYCADALGRYINTVRFSSERNGLGTLFEMLVKEKVITKNVPRDSLLRAAKLAIEEDLISDLPQYFRCWGMVIAHGGDTFPASLHYEFLSLMVEYHSPLDQIQRFIAEMDTFLVNPPTSPSGTAGGSSTTMAGPSGHSSVTSPLNATGGLSDGENDENSPCRRMRERIHLLPALLRFNFPLLSGEGQTKEEQDKILRLNENSVEVKVFQELVDDEGEVQLIVKLVKENPINAFPAVSALFTFMRFNISGQWERLKSSIRKIFTAPQITVLDLLEDVFVQWQYLEAPAEEYVQFVQKVKQLPNVQKDLVERLKDRFSQIDIRNPAALRDVIDQLDGHPPNNGMTGGGASHHHLHNMHHSSNSGSGGGGLLQRNEETAAGSTHGVPAAGGGPNTNMNSNNRRRKG